MVAQNNFPVALTLSLSHDGMYFAHVGHLRPGRSQWQFRANYVRIEWTKIKELQTDSPQGTLAMFGQACGDADRLTVPPGPWHIPRVVVRPKNCFPSALSEHCCHPLRPQCWGHNALLAMACCAVPYEQSLSTCLVSNPKFPNTNQDCRGHPLNFFRSFQDGNELKLVVGGRLSQPLQEVNASLSTGCLLQSILYLFHELHHLSRNGKLLEELPPPRLYSYALLFQAGTMLGTTWKQLASTRND